MKDYAKVINQSKEIHGQQQVRQTLARSAVQKSKEHREVAPAKKGSGFFTVVAIFVLIAILLAVYRQYMHHKEVMLADIPSSATNSAAAQEQQQQATSPQFDFYTVLPGGGNPSSTPDNSNTPSSTNAPGTTTTPTTTDTTTLPAATPAVAAPVQTIPATSSQSSGQYYLDAGEFSNEADAQQTLSQLLLLGVQASIKSMQENGAPSYQVLVGPFDDQDTMGVVKQQLTAHQIQASVIQQ